MKNFHSGCHTSFPFVNNECRCYVTWGFILFALTVEHEVMTGKFKSSNRYDNLLPDHDGAYLMPEFTSTLLECTGLCLLNRLCEGVLFNSILKECMLLRCSLFGLKTIESATKLKYFNLINGKY